MTPPIPKHVIALLSTLTPRAREKYGVAYLEEHMVRGYVKNQTPCWNAIPEVQAFIVNLRREWRNR